MTQYILSAQRKSLDEIEQIARETDGVTVIERTNRMLLIDTDHKHLSRIFEGAAIRRATQIKHPETQPGFRSGGPTNDGPG